MSFPVQEDGILVETTSSTISFSNTSKLLFMIPIWIASIGESPLLVALPAEQLEEHHLEISNRIRNLFWTVSGDYDTEFESE